MNIVKEEILISLEKYLQEFEIQDTFFNIKPDDEVDEVFSSLNNYMKNDLINFLNAKKNEFIKIIDKEYQNKKFSFEEKIIKNIIKKENISNIYNNQIENEINILKTKNIFSIDYITILVAGRAGVGKTALTSAMIKEDINLGPLFLDARPYRVYHSKNDLAFLNMIDTRGYELCCDFYKFDNIFNIIHKMKLESIESYNYNKNVQCIYYCVCSYLDKTEIEIINKIKNNKESIPIIVVNTHAIDISRIEKMEHLVKEELNLPFINVLAKKWDDINSYGLNDLLKLTLDVCSKSVNENLFNSIKKKICECANIHILEVTKNARYNIINNIIQKFTNFKNVVENKNLIELIYNYLEICFIEYKDIKGLNVESKNEFQKLNSLNDFIKEYIEVYQNLTKKIIEPILDNKSINFLDMQIKQEKKYTKSIKRENKNDKEKFKEIIKNFLEKNFYYISQKYLIYKLIEDFFIPFTELLKNRINEIIYKQLGNEQTKGLTKNLYDSVFSEFRLNVYKKFVNGKIYEENDNED